MATLVLIRLDCAAQEDWTGDDDIEIVVNGTAVWRGSMDEDEQKSLNNQTVTFDETATIRLLEKDWPDGDDDLGTVVVNEQETVATSRAARFTQDDANYTLWYTVYGLGGSDTGETGGAGGPPPDTGGVTDAEDTAPPAPDADTGVGGGILPCRLSRLIVEVRDPIANDGGPLPGASVRVTSRGLAGVTGADGRVDFGLQAPGNVVVEASKDRYYPFPAFTQATIGAGDEGECEETLVTLWLSEERVVEVQPRDERWYVNLDADENQRYGRQVTIRARISTRTSGVQVYFTLDADPNNRAGLPAESQASVEPASSLTNSEGWATTRLTLSTYGGDKFRVSASLSPNTRPGTAGARESGWLEVWRRIWYEVAQMKKPGNAGYWELAAGALGNVTPAMANVFIEMVSVGPTDNVNDTVENFDSATDGYEWADRHCSETAVPWKLHYAVVGHACTREEKDVEGTVNTATAAVGPQFRPYDFNGTNPIVRAQYKAASAGALTGWTNFAAGKVTLTGSNPRRQLRVDFSDSGVDPTVNPQRVRIRYIEAGPANGWGGSSLHVLICRGTFDEYYGAAANLGAIMGGTCVHEPGHSLGLVFGQEWETADAAHSAHCRLQNCVMWWQGYVGRPHDFHAPAAGDPGCGTYMRGLDMTRSSMEGRWGFPR